MQENYLENIRGYIISEQARTIVRDYNANTTSYNLEKGDIIRTPDGTQKYKVQDVENGLVTLEDGILAGGFGEKIARFYGASDMKVLNYGLKKEFLDRYDVKEVLKENRLTPEQILEDVLEN